MSGAPDEQRKFVAWWTGAIGEVLVDVIVGERLRLCGSISDPHNVCSHARLKS